MEKYIRLMEKQEIDFNKKDLQWLTYLNNNWADLNLKNKKKIIRKLSNRLCQKIGIPIVRVLFRKKLRNEDANATCGIRSHGLYYGLFFIPLYKQVTTIYKENNLTHNFSHNLRLVMHELRHAVCCNILKSARKQQKFRKLIESLDNPFLQETIKNYEKNYIFQKPNHNTEGILQPKEIDAEGFACKNLWNLYKHIEDKKFKNQLASCTLTRLDHQYRLFEAEKNNLRDDLTNITESNLIMNLCGFKPDKTKVSTKNKINQDVAEDSLPIENIVTTKPNNLEQ